MGRLGGRVALVTGGGRGLGRGYALALAAEGAAVVVNDLGVNRDGESSTEKPADDVVSEIASAGGVAITSEHDVSDWHAAEAMIQEVFDRLGSLDILVNNAGILRDRTIANMSQSEWDDVIRVHLKGHAAPTHHAMSRWRKNSKSGTKAQASVINTTSISGLFPNFGQTNYAAAKAGIAAFTQTVALEGSSYGVRANAVAPSANTRLVPGSSFVPSPSADGFDDMDPDNVSPLIVWLASPDCPATGQVFQMFGRYLAVYQLTRFAHTLRQEGQWTPDQLDAHLTDRLVPVKTAAEALDELTTDSVTVR